MTIRNLERALRATMMAGAVALVGCASKPTGLSIAKEEAAVAAAREKANAERLERETKSAEAYLKRVPSWVSDPPRSDGDAVYAVGSGESKRLDLAQRKAVLTAEFDLAKQYKQALSGSEQLFQRDGGGSATPQERYTLLIDRLVEQVELAGQEVIRRETVVRDGAYHHFVLMKLTWADMQRVLARQRAGSVDRSIDEQFAELDRRLRANRELKLREAAAQGGTTGSGSGTSAAATAVVAGQPFPGSAGAPVESREPRN